MHTKGLTETCQDSTDGPGTVLSEIVVAVSLSTGINRCRCTETGFPLKSQDKNSGLFQDLRYQ